MKIINNKVYIKILFFGTALAGKTTSLKWIFENVIPDEMKISDKMTSVKTSYGQTLLFDFAPIQLDQNIVIRIFTATGQDYYSGTRKMLFRDVDGIFFLIDSQKKEFKHNQEFVEEFKKYLDTVKGVKEAEVIVLCNKSDLEDIYNPDYLRSELNLGDYPFYTTNSLTGENLKVSFTMMIDKMLRKIKEKEIHEIL